MKFLGIALLCIASLVILLRVVVPAACLVLGLGIDIPNTWARSTKVLFFYSHPWVPTQRLRDDVERAVQSGLVEDGQRDEGVDGSSHAGSEDRGHHFNRLEERSWFRR